MDFINIPVEYTEVKENSNGFANGTTLIIDSLRETWSREDLLSLKRSLMKLISPDVSEGDMPFDIELIVPSERINDQKTLQNQE